MPAVAKWLLARPQNAIIALAVSLLLPAPQLTSGAILVALLLARGPRPTVIAAAVAAAAIAAATAILGGSLAIMLVLMAATWLPLAALATLLAVTRSLTLVVQVTVILALAGLLAMQLAIPDAEAFWQPYLETMSTSLRQGGIDVNMALLTPEIMTMSAVLAHWLLYTVGLLLGYALYRALPGDGADYGRFRDLDLGRVIAGLAAAISLLALLTQAVAMQNAAFLVFATFTLQGLAILHWLKSRGLLPGGALVATYVLLPLLQVLVISVLALVGFTDAWMRLRRRDIEKQG